MNTRPMDMDNQGGQSDQGVADFTYNAVQNIGYPKRKFIGFSPLLSAAEQAALSKELGLRSIPGALLRGPRPTEFPQYITTPVLYDAEGRVYGRQYDLANDPFVISRELAKLSTEERIRISQELKRIGWYGSGKPSEALMQGFGWSSDDEKVWANLFDVANNAQRPWTDVVGMLGSFASAKGTGSTIRVTSDEDAAAYTREVFLSELGRMPTRKEMADAANFIRARERQAFAAGQQIPNAGLVAQQFAQKEDPTSRTVYGLGNAIALAMQALGQ